MHNIIVMLIIIVKYSDDNSLLDGQCWLCDGKLACSSEPFAPLNIYSDALGNEQSLRCLRFLLVIAI